MKKFSSGGKLYAAYTAEDMEIWFRKEQAVKRINNLSGVSTSTPKKHKASDLFEDPECWGYKYRDNLIQMVDSTDSSNLVVAEAVIEQEYKNRGIMMPTFG